MIWRVFLLAITAASLFGQTEAILRKRFEGRNVRVKIDMPATKEGVDMHFGQDPPIESKSYSSRIRNRGVSLRKGDSVMVTTVKVKEKNIEFQLGGGGYGVWGDETATVSTPSVSKSSRERDLERDIKRETDSRRRDSMSRELSALESSRRREETRLRAEAMRLQEIKRQEIYEKALRAGSRFNLWFPKGYLKEWVPTPEEVMKLLSDFVEFDEFESRQGPDARAPVEGLVPRPSTPTAAPADAISSIRRGMTADELHRLLGSPARVKDSQQGDLTSRIETFNTRDNEIIVTLVEGLVVRYTVNSR